MGASVSSVDIHLGLGQPIPTVRSGLIEAREAGRLHLRHVEPAGSTHPGYILQRGVNCHLGLEAQTRSYDSDGAWNGHEVRRP